MNVSLKDEQEVRHAREFPQGSGTHTGCSCCIEYVFAYLQLNWVSLGPAPEYVPNGRGRRVGLDGQGARMRPRDPAGETSARHTATRLEQAHVPVPPAASSVSDTGKLGCFNPPTLTRLQWATHDCNRRHPLRKVNMWAGQPEACGNWQCQAHRQRLGWRLAWQAHMRASQGRTPERGACGWRAGRAAAVLSQARNGPRARGNEAPRA
jgi:hypothetical protein